MLALSFAVSYFYYRNQLILKELSRIMKWMLISIRAFALFILGLLLFGIILESKDYKTEKPIFITLIDNSTSMLNYGDSNSVENYINEFNKKLAEKYSDRFDLKTITVGARIKEEAFNLSDLRSDLNEGFDHIYNQFYNRNIGGICFISDGNYNTGKNPVYSAEKIPLTPIFAIGVGDTIVKRDHLIRNISVNDVAFLNNEFPIQVDVEARKLGKGESRVSLWQGGEKIAEKKINYENGALDFVSTTFLVEAKSVGFKNYTIRLNEEKRESSYENNTRSFYVEVIDSRTKILLLSEAPHPDITAIRQVIDVSENMEADAVLMTDWDREISGYNLVIWQSPKEFNSSVIDKIKTQNLPVLYLLTPYTSSSEVNKINGDIIYPSGTRSDEVQGSVNSGFQLFEVSDELQKAISLYPPLNAKFGSSSLKGGRILVNQSIGGVVKQDPLIAFGSTDNKKSCVVFGEGLWRWRITNFARYGNHDSFNELIQKTLQYLTVKQNQEPLRINLPKRFNEVDDIIINAEFYNSSFEPIVTPDISLMITDSESKEHKYSFAKNDKDYVVSLGKLNKGEYKWKATTSFEGKTYMKDGVFVVENTSIESMSTHANHNLLQQIASKSNGKFLKLAQINSIFNEIDSRKDIGNISYEESSFKDLVDWKLLFVILILLLGVEWFLRRYNGSY